MPNKNHIMVAGSHRRRRRGRVGRLPAKWVAAAFAGLAAIPVIAGLPVSAGAYNPTDDPYSMASITEMMGAVTWWEQGYTGRGVDVALIDTGVAPVVGLSGPGKLIHGPDLSLESQAPALARLDTNGHGTFMAGLIAGKDPGFITPYQGSTPSLYRGVAPDARIVSVKVGTADGGVDVSQVIAAIDWVVQHKNDNGMNIRVINLSYGTNSTQSWEVDPLSYAVEQAWKRGIVVVAAAGNSGYQRGSNAPGLANPAYNPYVIAVGGYDTMKTAARTNDVVGTYSASSNLGSAKRPDFVAVGSHVQGLRVPNSHTDATHPEGRIDARYFRGSGTSQAAAIASGAAALILQKYPGLSPGEVKQFIVGDATKISAASTSAQGAGEVNLTSLATQTPTADTQAFTTGSGTGQLEGSRGQDHLSRDGVALTGEIDVFGKPFNSAAIATAEAAAASWSGGSWNGSTWSGSTWSGSTWSGSTWSGSTWSGSTWSGSTWSGSSWSGSSWSGSSWSGSTWSGNSWATGSWS